MERTEPPTTQPTPAERLAELHRACAADYRNAAPARENADRGDAWLLTGATNSAANL